MPPPVVNETRQNSTGQDPDLEVVIGVHDDIRYCFDEFRREGPRSDPDI